MYSGDAYYIASSQASRAFVQCIFGAHEFGWQQGRNELLGNG